MEQKPKCIVILSTKSAGSTALQTLVCRFGGAQHVAYTRHGEFETLYWVKAASILGMPQTKLPDSEVPIPKGRAERDLRRFLERNVPGFVAPSDPWLFISRGWRALCRRYAPTFIEKSPHHLHQWSALELLTRITSESDDIDIRFIGLVRNPMDVLYSAWQRWRTRPEELQHHWQMAYENLRRWRNIVGEKLYVARYEDFVSRRETTVRLFEFLQLKQREVGVENFMHSSSLQKWKSDGRFGFQLHPTVAETALSWGYTDDEIYNTRRLFWMPYSRIMRAGRQLWTRPIIRAKRSLRRYH